MNIRLSPKHGVNPVVPVCFFCGGPKQEVILTGLLPGDVEAPRGVYDVEPCDGCKRIMAAGIIVISIDEAKTTDPKNPWRTGGWCAVREQAIRRLRLAPALEADILRRRVVFITDEAYDAVGFPRGELPGVPNRIEDFR